MQQLLTLWESHEFIAYWQIILIGLFFLIGNLVIFAAMWFVNREVIIEYGYRKRNRKTLKKRLKAYPLIDSILLIRLVAEAPRQGLYLLLVIMCHFLHLIGIVLSFIGFVCAIITHVDGWALILLIGSELPMVVLTTAIRFIPDLICLPSEKKRYSK